MKIRYFLFLLMVLGMINFINAETMTLTHNDFDMTKFEVYSSYIKLKFSTTGPIYIFSNPSPDSTWKIESCNYLIPNDYNANGLCNKWGYDKFYSYSTTSNSNSNTCSYNGNSFYNGGYVKYVMYNLKCENINSLIKTNLTSNDIILSNDVYEIDFTNVLDETNGNITLKIKINNETFEIENNTYSGFIETGSKINIIYEFEPSENSPRLLDDITLNLKNLNLDISQKYEDGKLYYQCDGEDNSLLYKSTIFYLQNNGDWKQIKMSHEPSITFNSTHSIINLKEKVKGLYQYDKLYLKCEIYDSSNLLVSKQTPILEIYDLNDYDLLLPFHYGWEFKKLN